MIWQSLIFFYVWMNFILTAAATAKEFHYGFIAIGYCANMLIDKIVCFIRNRIYESRYTKFSLSNFLTFTQV